MPEAQSIPEEQHPAIGGIILIAELPPGFFWARPETIGSSQTEALAFERGGVEPDRVIELKAATKLASEYLRNAPAGRA